MSKKEEPANAPRVARGAGWAVLAAMLGLLAPTMQATPPPPALGVTAITVASAAGSYSVILTATGAWLADANASFLHLASGSMAGTGSALVVFSVDEYTGTGTRTGTLTIDGLTLTVTQAAANYAQAYAGITLASGLNSPGPLTVDGSGNVYFGNYASSIDMGGFNYPTGPMLEEWSPSTQQVTTVLGDNSSLNTSSHLTGTDLWSGCVADVLAPGTYSGVIGTTWILWLGALVADSSGNVYWPASADTYGICKYSPGSGPMPVGELEQWVSPVGGDTSPETGLAMDAHGNLYAADAADQLIWKWNPAAQQLTTIANVPPNQPGALAVDGLGNLYFTDWQEVCEWNAATQQVTVLMPASGHNFVGLAANGSGDVYVLDDENNGIYKWSAAAQQATLLFSYWEGMDVSFMLQSPNGIALDADGNIYVSDNGDNAIREFIPTFEGLAVTSLQEGHAAGSDSVAVSFLPASSTLPWSANTTTSWLHLPLPGWCGSYCPTYSSASGTGAGTLQFTFDANTGAVRTGVITLDSGLTLTVTQASPSLEGQTIIFAALANQPYGTAPFTVSATASSGLAVSFSAPSGSVCTVSGAAVTLAAVGLCVIQATQAGNAIYAAALPVSQSFQVTAVVKTPSPVSCDLNGDGVVNVQDVQNVINQAMGLPGGAAIGTGDFSGGGAIGVVDVQIVINSALGDTGSTYWSQNEG